MRKGKARNVEGLSSNVVKRGALAYQEVRRLIRPPSTHKLTMPSPSSASAFICIKRGLTSSYPDNGGSNSTETSLHFEEPGVW